MPNSSGWFKSTKNFIFNYFPPFSGIASAAMVGIKLIFDIFSMPKEEKTEFILTLSTGLLDLIGAMCILSLMWNDDRLNKKLHFSKAHLVRKYGGAGIGLVLPLFALSKFGMDYWKFLDNPLHKDSEGKNERISDSSILYWEIALSSGGFLLFSFINAFVSFTLYYWPDVDERNAVERTYRILGLNLKFKSNSLKRDKYGLVIAELSTLLTS